jgi:hypothetical protein
MVPQHMIARSFELPIDRFNRLQIAQGALLGGRLILIFEISQLLIN